MKRSLLALTMSLLAVSSVFADPTIGKAAPDFTATDSRGKTQSLSAYKGKFVVLEWTNHGCPFVHKHYDSGNMQKLQETYTGKGVVWLSVISSAEGKEGYVTPADAEKERAEYKSKATAIILDPKADLARLYIAKTTPHMFIINPEGNLIYMGAIDNKPSTDAADIPSSINYVSQALDAALAGKSVKTASTKSYGCSVKYASK